MYLEHFGFTDFPFIQSAKDELFFTHAQSRQHCADIHHWLDAGHGMLVIAGEQGVGRSSLAHHALDTANIPVIERYVVSGLPLSPVELLQSIAIDMGLPMAGYASAELETIRIRHQIRAHLRSQASLGRRTCLVVHDADRLSDQTLAYLEDLGKDHTFYLPLCHIMLLVNKSFAARVVKQKKSTGARYVQKVLTVRPLNQADMRGYIEHRLVQAGLPDLEGQVLFSSSVFKVLHSSTKGKPYLINELCNLSLVKTYRNSAPVMRDKHVDSALGELGWETSAAKKAASRAVRKVEEPVQKKTSTPEKMGALERSVHELVSGVTTIGRAPDCSIRINGASVSPYQALIVRTDDGMFIRNEGSQLPLYLNGSRVESANLSAGDTVSLGNHRFSVDLDTAGTLTLASIQSEPQPDGS